MADTPNKAAFGDTETLTANVLKVWERVTREDLADGIGWYVEAAEIAEDIAAATPYSTNQVIGVISAMSPRMPWGRNKVVARKIVERHVSNNRDEGGLGLKSNVRLSYQILDGTDVASVLKNKRLAFYQNIAGDVTRATIDSWMMKVIFGTTTEYVSPGSWYTLCEDVIIAASALAGINPRDFQAALWVRIRRDMLTANEHANYEREV